MKLKPNNKRVLIDTLIVTILVFVSFLLRDYALLEALLAVTIIMVPISAIYYYIMVVLPYIEIESGNNTFIYKSDYGRKKIISIPSISKIEMGSGLGGYEHALFVRYEDANSSKTLKVKSSYFNQDSIRELVSVLRGINTEIQINEELEKFIQSKS